jgi:membrane-associated protein
VVSGIYYFAMIAITPLLIVTHPVLLEMLSGSTSSIVVAGAFSDIDSKLQMTVVVAAALPGLMKFDLFYWWAGVLWGRRALLWFGSKSSRKAGTVSRIERFGPRFAGPIVALSAFLPIAPTPLVFAAVGSVGMGPFAFLIFDTIGSTAWAILLGVLGYNLGPEGVAVANVISRYALISALVLLAIALLPQVFHLLRVLWAHVRPGRADAPADTP